MINRKQLLIKYDERGDRIRIIKDYIKKIRQNTIDLYDDIYVSGNKVTFEMYGSYQRLQVANTSLEADLGMSVDLRMNWYSEPHMLFAFNPCPFVEVWYHCDPENVPSELTGNCVIEKHIIPSHLTYTVECKV